MVRVGGFSARFVHLSPEAQDEIIRRRRHRDYGSGREPPSGVVLAGHLSPVGGLGAIRC
jgi:hypothetical protein